VHVWLFWISFYSLQNHRTKGLRTKNQAYTEMSRIAEVSPFLR
jgi:hypothetical protein